MTAITLISLSWSLLLRGRNITDPPLSNIPVFPEFNPYVVGFNVQVLIVPLVLVFLFSRTQRFQDAIRGECPPRKKWQIFGGFTLILLLELSYELRLYILSPDRFSLGFLILITGGLLGGWQVGLGLGLLTMLMIGSEKFIVEIGAFKIIQEVLHDDGAIGLFLVAKELVPHIYLDNLQASTPIWIGTFAGLSGELLGKNRFSLASALVLGLFSDLWVNLLALIPERLPIRLMAGTLPAVLTSGAALAAVALIVQGVQAEDARKRELIAQHALTQAELRALRTQINPHFLFNTLNTIRYFVRTDTETARQLLLDLSEIFQHVLRAGVFVPLEEEIRYAKAYLTLEKARLGERLEIHWNLPDETSPWMNFPVPTLTLQPIVENAVIHGISPKPEGGKVAISIQLETTSLLFRVVDSGVGIDPQRQATLLIPTVENQCVGLCNVNSRLKAIYGIDSTLKIESQPGEGTRVEIAIPVKPDSEKFASPDSAKEELDENPDRG